MLNLLHGSCINCMEIVDCVFQRSALLQESKLTGVTHASTRWMGDVRGCEVEMEVSSWVESQWGFNNVRKRKMLCTTIEGNHFSKNSLTLLWCQFGHIHTRKQKEESQYSYIVMKLSNISNSQLCSLNIWQRRVQIV